MATRVPQKRMGDPSSRATPTCPVDTSVFVRSLGQACRRRSPRSRHVCVHGRGLVIRRQAHPWIHCEISHRSVAERVVACVAAASAIIRTRHGNSRGLGGGVSAGVGGSSLLGHVRGPLRMFWNTRIPPGRRRWLWILFPKTISMSKNDCVNILHQRAMMKQKCNEEHGSEIERCCGTIGDV